MLPIFNVFGKKFSFCEWNVRITIIFLKSNSVGQQVWIIPGLQKKRHSATLETLYNCILLQRVYLFTFAKLQRHQFLGRNRTFRIISWLLQLLSFSFSNTTKLCNTLLHSGGNEKNWNNDNFCKYITPRTRASWPLFSKILFKGPVKLTFDFGMYNFLLISINIFSRFLDSLWIV